MDIPHLLTTGNYVKNVIKKMADARRSSFCNVSFPEILEASGGMKIDGLKNNLTGVNYFDFAFCWYNIGPVDMITRDRPVTIRSCVLFCEE